MLKMTITIMQAMGMISWNVLSSLLLGPSSLMGVTYAERFGLSRSAYVRSRCVYKPGTYVEVDRGLLADCFRELRRQGVNLNQIAKEINSAARVARAADAVSRLRPEIEKCLHEIYEATQRYIHIMSGVEHNGYR